MPTSVAERGGGGALLRYLKVQGNAGEDHLLRVTKDKVGAIHPQMTTEEAEAVQNLDQDLDHLIPLHEGEIVVMWSTICYSKLGCSHFPHQNQKQNQSKERSHQRL